LLDPSVQAKLFRSEDEIAAEETLKAVNKKKSLDTHKLFAGGTKE
jgi:hypothetical protein